MPLLCSKVGRMDLLAPRSKAWTNHHWSHSDFVDYRFINEMKLLMISYVEKVSHTSLVMRR